MKHAVKILYDKIILEVNMICDICKKNNATIFITEIINNEKKELHLCYECAANLGLKGILKELNLPYDENIIKKFLSLMPGFIEEG
ncbi:MAG: hypothetical protein ACK4WJ_06450, partial [Endomicrobiia bacterium]